MAVRYEDMAAPLNIVQGRCFLCNGGGRAPKRLDGRLRGQKSLHLSSEAGQVLPDGDVLGA